MSRLAVFALLGFLTLAACAGMGYRPPPGDQSGPVHGETGGGGGGSM
jgi:hypothetical protein